MTILFLWVSLSILLLFPDSVRLAFPSWFPTGSWGFENPPTAGQYPVPRIHPCLVRFPRLPPNPLSQPPEPTVSTIFLFGGTQNLNLTEGGGGGPSSSSLSDLWSFRAGAFRRVPYVPSPPLVSPPSRLGAFCFRKRKQTRRIPSESLPALFDFFVGGGIGVNVSSPTTGGSEYSDQVLDDLFWYRGEYGDPSPAPGPETNWMELKLLNGSLSRVFSNVWDVDVAGGGEEEEEAINYHTMAYVFGGLDENFLPTNDVFVYNGSHYEERLETGPVLHLLSPILGPVPSPRFGSVSWTSNENSVSGPWFWLFGGSEGGLFLEGTSRILQDLYLFRPGLNITSPWVEWVSQNSWEFGVEIEDLRKGFPGRVHACGVGVPVAVSSGAGEGEGGEGDGGENESSPGSATSAGFLFGGVSVYESGTRTGMGLSSMWWYNYHIWQWVISAVAPGTEESELGRVGSSTVPGSRFGCVMWPADESDSASVNAIYLFGGYGNSTRGEGQGGGGHFLNELWRYDFEEPSVTFWSMIEYLQRNAVPFVGMIFMVGVFPVLVVFACGVSCGVMSCVDRRREEKLRIAEEEKLKEVFERTNDPEAALRAVESIENAVVELDAADANLSEKLGHYLLDSGASVVNIVSPSPPSHEGLWKSSGGDLDVLVEEAAFRLQKELPHPIVDVPKGAEKLSSVDDDDDPELIAALKSLRMMDYLPGFRKRKVIYQDLASLPKGAFKTLVPDRVPRIRLQKRVGWVDESKSSSSLRRPKWRLFQKDVKLGELISSGSFGSVRRGKFNVGVATIDVAIKQIVYSRRSRTTMDSVMAEVRIMARCRHPNVLQCFGCFFQGQAAFVVMELCSTSLNEKKITRLTRLDRLGYLEQTAKGMQYLHENKIVHRDLKPANILVHPDGTVRICDFGTSKDREEVSDTFCGTVDYMAPEMIGDIENIMLVDVYAFGILCWEIWTGDEPYSHLKTTQTLQVFALIHTGARPLRPSLKHDGMVDCPQQLKNLMSKCWLPVPSDRPQSFDEILPELEAIHTTIVSEDGPEGGVAVARGPVSDSDSSSDERAVMTDSSSDGGIGNSVVHVPTPTPTEEGTSKPTFLGIDIPEVESSSDSEGDDFSTDSSDSSD